MNEQIRKTLEPLRQFWDSTSRTVRRVIIGGVVVALIVALALSILLNTKDYVVIFDQLSASETSEILAALSDSGVDVKLDKNGSVMVPKADESKVRMQLATKGYPKSGLSYYLIQQNSGMLTTDYERKQYMNMQLQERIAASIKTLDGVSDAVVTLTIPQEDVFYMQDKEKPSASVIIHMKPGNTLTEGQILGIQNLVAKSVQGLSKDNIALTDSEGNDLLGSANSNSPEYSKLGVTREYENDIKKKVTAVLLGPYQSGQFKVSVTAAVDTDASVTESTLYSPSPAGNNSGVISEETHNQESTSSSSIDGGVAGTSSNSQVPTYPAGGQTGQNASSTSSSSIKYQVSQTKSQIQKNGAKIESVSIGIAINKASFDPGERESITQLVAYAAGVSAASISVQNFQFPKEEAPAATQTQGGINKLILYGGIGAGVLVLGALTALVLMRRRKKAAVEEGIFMARPESAEDALNMAFGEAEPVEVIKPITPVQDARREEIKQFAKSNPEIAAQMIKTWLRSED